MLKNKKHLIISIFFIFILLITGNIFAGLNESLANAKNLAGNISLSSFRNGDNKLKSAYLDDFEGIGSTISIAENESEITGKNQLYQDALNVVNRLLLKTDGCIANNTADDDWIVNCDDALTLNNALKQLASDINALIQQ